MKRTSGSLTFGCVVLSFAGFACTEMHESDGGAFDEDASVAPASCADASLSCTGNHSDGGSQTTKSDGGAPSTDGGTPSQPPREDAGPSGGKTSDAGPAPREWDSGASDAGPSDTGRRDAGTVADAGSAGDGRTCGGLLGETCQAREFCNMEPDAGGDGCLNIADGEGVCTARPSACSDENAPVCGCDFRSYSNACEAHADGVSVLYEGLCTEIECLALGGLPTYSDGASIPSCRGGEDSFAIHGLEPAVCCLPNPRSRPDR